jgi:integrase
MLFGAAMDEYERQQAAKAITSDPRRLVMRRSALPLRGICLIAFRTLMRPENNFSLRWEQIFIDPVKVTGSFRLSDHKNASKGIEVIGPLAPSLVRYLISIRPGEKTKGLIHPNPATGKAYKNIRKQWKRLVEIANSKLADDEKVVALDFYNLRHTGASQLAESGADPVMICRMMGDVNLETVLRHYFDSSLTHMQDFVARWDGVQQNDETRT